MRSLKKHYITTNFLLNFALQFLVNKMSEEKKSLNFIEQIIEEDLAKGMPKTCGFVFLQSPTDTFTLVIPKPLGLALAWGVLQRSCKLTFRRYQSS